MPATADRCRETSTTTGTGSVTLAGAATQYQSFNTAFGSSPVTVMYAIVGQTGTEWEVGKGTYNGSITLSRDVVRSSSNANALVSFSAGTKDVFATVTAEQLDNANIGMQLAQVQGWAMP
jgi:hypothetical protein